MTHALWMTLCLLAGCASAPTVIPGPLDAAPGAGTEEPTTLPMPPRTSGLRVGVEFLPPDLPGLTEAAPTPRPEAIPGYGARPATAVAPPPPRLDRSQRERPHLWTMRPEDLAAVPEAAARHTLIFIDDMLGEDRRRIRREIGTPILGLESLDLSATRFPTHSDEELAEAEAEAVAEHGMRLLQRPLRNLARRTPLVRGLELQLEDFKSENVPLTKAYREHHPEQRQNLGRVSMRLRAGDLQDPVELAYTRSGVRLGSGQQVGKIGLVRWLADDVALEVHSRCRYETGKWSLRSDLVWYANDHTSLHLVVGDDLDFLTSSSVYSLFESPMDGSPGLLLHAVHLF